MSHTKSHAVCSLIGIYVSSAEKNRRQASHCLICDVVFYILFFSLPPLSSLILFFSFTLLIYLISSFLQTSGQETLCNDNFIIERTVIKRLLLNTVFLELSSHRSCLFFLLNSLPRVTATVSD